MLVKLYHIDSYNKRFRLFRKLAMTGTCVVSMDFLKTEQILYLNGLENSRASSYTFSYYMFGRTMKDMCRDDYIFSEDWL